MFVTVWRRRTNGCPAKAATRSSYVMPCGYRPRRTRSLSTGPSRSTSSESRLGAPPRSPRTASAGSGTGRPRRARRDVGEEGRPGARDGEAERPRVDRPSAVACPFEPHGGMCRGPRSRAVPQRVARFASPGDVREEVDQEPADRAVGPAPERLELCGRRLPARRGEPETVGTPDAPARKRDARRGGPRPSRDARGLLERERHGERRRGDGAGREQQEGDGDAGEHPAPCGANTPPRDRQTAAALATCPFAHVESPA